MKKQIKTLIIFLIIGCAPSKELLDMSQIMNNYKYSEINGLQYFGLLDEESPKTEIIFDCNDNETSSQNREAIMKLEEHKMRKIIKKGFKVDDMLNYIENDGYLKFRLIVDQKGKTIYSRIHETNLDLSKTDSIDILSKLLNTEVSESSESYSCVSLTIKYTKEYIPSFKHW